MLLWLSAAATLLAAAMAAAGGFTIELGAFRASLHTVTRPVVVAVALGGLGLWALGANGARRQIDRLSASVARDGLLVACAFASAIGIAAFAGGAHIAGGADSSGYLSEARLWRVAGGSWNPAALFGRTPLSRELSLTNGQHAFTPVGHQPAAIGTIVPGYPPGLPILLALAGATGGKRAQFAVVPLAAAGLVVVVFLIGRRIGGSETALIAAAATGASPILLYQAMQPMSDVVAAFWWTLALSLLLSSSNRAHAGAGAAAAIACAVRPNLFVMAPVIALLAWWWKGFERRALIPIAWFLLPMLVAALMLASLQRFLYGSAATSGFGGISSLFGFGNIWPNLTRDPGWAIFTQSGLLLAAVAGPIAVPRGWVAPAMGRAVAERIAWSGLLFYACLQAFYLLYISFDDWVYFRFLLPALPWVLVLQGIAIAAVCRVTHSRRGLVALLLAVLLASWGAGRARGLGAFRLRDSEQR